MIENRMVIGEYGDHYTPEPVRDCGFFNGHSKCREDEVAGTLGGWCWRHGLDLCEWARKDWDDMDATERQELTDDEAKYRAARDEQRVETFDKAYGGGK